MIHEAERELRQEENRWQRADLWIWPPPVQAGFELDPADQSLVRDVLNDSAARAAGLRPKDRLLRLGSQRIRTIHDVQWVFENSPSGPTEIPVEIERDDRPETTVLHLKPGWKVGTPLIFSWRSAKWGLRPAPGFGNHELDSAEKTALGIDPSKFAARVEYLVTWGEEAALGRSAIQAGIKKGDVLVAAAGVDDFRSEDHFQAWFRLTRMPGEKIELRLLRDGKPVTVQLTVRP
jgi:S1-C subfamily serine protease